MNKNEIHREKLVEKLKEIAFIDSKEVDSQRENANIDSNTPMGMMLKYGSESSKVIGLEMINEEYAKAHLNGDIHIHDLDFLSIGTTTCTNINLEKLFTGGFSTGHGFLREPNSISAYASLSAIVIQSNQNSQHGGQSIPAYDYYLRKGIIKSYRKHFKANISKYLDIKLELSEEEVEKHTEKIMEEFGEIESIDISRTKLNVVVLKELSEKIECSEAIGISRSMVEFVLRKSEEEIERETYQAMEGFIHNLNTMNSRAGSQTPFSSISFGTDTSPEGRMVSRNLMLAQEAGLGNGETAIFPISIFKVKDGVNMKEGDPNYDLFKLACRVSSKRLFPNFAFLDAPYNLQYYKEGDFDTEVTYMGCRSRTMANLHGDEVVSGRGNVSFTSINLPRLGIKHGLKEKADIDEFFIELDEKVDLVVNQLIERLEIQGNKTVKNFPFLMGQGVWKGSDKLNKDDKLKEVLKHGSLTVGFIGLAETLVALTKKHHGECEESQELGKEIIGRMRKRLDEASEKHKLNFALIGTPGEGLAGRYLRIDREVYGEIEGVTDKEYYTNSFHVPVGYQISAFKKINIEAPYHTFTNGGHISYVELDGDVSNNQEAFEKIIIAMAKSGIGYGSINHPIDIDPVCGFRGVIYDECPSCGRKENNDGIPFDRIRRITGYLVGTTERFNDAKQAEVRDRVKHM